MQSWITVIYGIYARVILRVFTEMYDLSDIRLIRYVIGYMQQFF